MPEGMKIDDRKVEAIKQMSAPKDKKGLQSFQNMINCDPIWEKQA